MATTDINTHLAKNIKWDAYRYSDNSLLCVFTKDSAAYDISDMTFRVKFRTPGGSSDLLELEEGDGLTKDGSGGTLLINLAKEEITEDLKRDRYFVLIEYDYEGGPYPLATGYIYLNKETNPDNTSTTVTIPVNTAMTQINMEVNLFGGSGSFDIDNITSEQAQALLDKIATYMTTAQRQTLAGLLDDYIV